MIYCWKLLHVITVDTQNLQVTGKQKKNLSYREFEFSRNGLEIMTIRRYCPCYFHC